MEQNLDRPYGRDLNDPLVDLASPAIHVVYGLDGSVRHIDHIHDLAFGIGEPKAEDLADAYVSANIGIFAPNQQLELILPVSPYFGYESGEDIRLRGAESTSTMGTTTVHYVQTWRGVPVWEAGLAVTVSPHQAGRLRVTGAHSTLHLTPMAVGYPPDTPYGPNNITGELLRRCLYLPADAKLKIYGQPRLLSYRYRTLDRLQGVALGIRQPTEDTLAWQLPPLPLPLVPDQFAADQHYFVTEVLFNLKAPTLLLPLQAVNWRVFVEVETGVVLYLRDGVTPCLDKIFLLDSPVEDGDAEPALDGVSTGEPPKGDTKIVQAKGHVFTSNPLSDTGADELDPATGLKDAAIAALRQEVPLLDLIPTRDDKQRLTGSWVQITDLAAPPDAPSDVAALGLVARGQAFEFDYDVRRESADFTAVNAYYHCNAMFRLLKRLKLFNVFFRDNPEHHTLTVDPLGMGGDVGAYVTGNGDWTQAESIIFGMAQQDTDNGVGAASDVRVVLHEFCHVLLWAKIGAPTLSFAHSAGDSLAAILSDPCSPLSGDERYETFPWLMRENQHLGSAVDWRYHGGDDRRCDASGEGWCWGGDKDVHDPGDPAGYRQEQLLSTTLFRIYDVIGGEPGNTQTIREHAAAYMAYLIIRAISLLPPAGSVPTNLVEPFVTLLANADRDTTDDDNPVPDTIPGGSITKVIYWSFTEQGLYQSPSGPAAAPPLVTGPGQPEVDVCIGAEDSYPRPNGGADAVWNRNAPGFSRQHEGPIAGQPNHVYVEVRNRGWAPATGVVVQGSYHPDEPALHWKSGGVWVPMSPPAAGTNPNVIPVGASAIFGPFTWTPPAPGDWWLLMSVSAAGDPSNIDPGVPSVCAVGPTPLDRIVPFDNNIALRKG